MIGFDNINAAAYTSPRLTTIHQPLDEIGRTATQCLLNRLHNTVVPPDEVVEPILVARESTRPVRGS